MAVPDATQFKSGLHPVENTGRHRQFWDPRDWLDDLRVIPDTWKSEAGLATRDDVKNPDGEGDSCWSTRLGEILGKKPETLELLAVNSSVQNFQNEIRGIRCHVAPREDNRHGTVEGAGLP